MPKLTVFKILLLSCLFRSVASAINYRLPTHVIPNRYELLLKPEFVSFTFTGQVVIFANVVQSAYNITLHSYNLTINGDVSVQSGSSFQTVSRTEFNTDLQFLIIYFNNPLPVGNNYKIIISFQGILNNNKEGFYRASYQTESGVTRWLATTQFESTAARQAFPCFDEPAYKAVFLIQIGRPRSYNTASNMFINGIFQIGADTFLDVYEVTPKMSTYLVAFVVSDFGKAVNGIQSIRARPAAIANGWHAFSLDVAQRTLNALVAYTNVPYTLSKMEQVAIPDSYFAAGAMENWGLVTYKEKYVLYKDAISTSNDQLLIATICAHEFSHQWFGDLVTPVWWNYIWLNEGFATYFEFYIAGKVQPSWNVMDQFSIKVLQAVLELDSVLNIRPITYDAGSPAEIDALFDRIAYYKAGAVLRMAEGFLSEAVFQNGLSLYLNERKYDTVTEYDLWRNLQAALFAIPCIELPMPLKDIMTTWTSQSGYPVIYVNRNFSTGTINITQERFFTSGFNEDYQELWPIPINFATGVIPDFNKTSAKFWLTEKSLEIPIPELEWNPKAWLILNKQQTGYYRVNYDIDNWNLIISHLNSEHYETIHMANRAQLIDDAFNLARAGYLDYGIAFNLVSYIFRETNYVPLFSFFKAITYIERFYSAAAKYDSFTSYVLELLQTVFAKLGVNEVENEPFVDKLNRVNVLNWLTKLGDEACLAEMRKKLMTVVPPNLQEPVYCGGVKVGGIPEFIYVAGTYTITLEDMKRQRLLNALGCSQSKILLNRLLLMSLDEDTFKARPEDRASAFVAAYSQSQLGVNLSLDFLMLRYDDILKKLTYDEVQTILSGLSLRIVSAEQQQKFTNFVGKFSNKDRFATALNNIISNMLFLNRMSEINVWLDNNNGPGTTTSTTASSTTTTTTTVTTITTTDSDVTTTDYISTTPGSASTLFFNAFLFNICCLIIYSLT